MRHSGIVILFWKKRAAVKILQRFLLQSKNLCAFRRETVETDIDTNQQRGLRSLNHQMEMVSHKAEGMHLVPSVNFIGGAIELLGVVRPQYAPTY